MRMNSRLISAFALLTVLFSPSAAQAVSLSDFELTAVIQVISYNDDEEYYYSGTGFLINYTSGCALTATHVILDETSGDIREALLVVFDAGTDSEESYWAKSIVAYTDVDTAIVCIDDDEYEPRFRHYFEFDMGLFESMEVGDTLTALGYPTISGATLTASFGQLTGFQPWNDDKDILKTDIEVSGGLSGGPVISENNDVVGMVISYDDPEEGGLSSYAVSAGLLDKIVDVASAQIIEAVRASGTIVIPDDCTRDEESGRYFSEGISYYDGFCSVRVDLPKEQLLTNQFEHWCESSSKPGYITSAVSILNANDTELGVADWQGYLDNLCGELDADDSYRYAMPNQDMGATLIKSEEYSSVYAVLEDGKRHAFANEEIFKSWFGEDFSGVTTVSSETLASYQLGRNTVFHPGTLVKIPSIPEVYLVSDDNELRWVQDEETAIALYGDNWAKQVHDVSESLSLNYGKGEKISME